MKRRNTNPFDDGNDTPRESLRERYEGSNNNKESAPSSYLFPNFLSSWMATEISSLPSSNNSILEDEAIDDNDDESLYRYHDCISQEEEIDTSSDYENDETTTLLSALSPLRRQSIRSYNATSNTPIRKNTGTDIRIDTVTSQSSQQNAAIESIYSPLSQALATWLSPYADSAKRAGRKIMFSEEEDSLSSVGNSQHSNIVGEETLHSVRFHSDHLESNNGQRKSRLTPSSALGRTLSSPALMTTMSNDNNNTGIIVESSSDSGIVLKDIVVQGENNTQSDDNNGGGIVIHPWTKLILLEELGTAWSWFVLLLPYVFLILAVFLDGDTQFKHTIVGPLRGNRSCDDMVRGSVPTPFDESVKGYYPVPFHFEDGHKHKSSNNTIETTAKFNGSCTFPFELREGVGLLSHGKDAASNSTLSSSSILNSRYRYLMSHGHAFTSGVISNVPPTSQSLRGSVKFNNLSSRAVALVARGSVLVSAIVFQRPISGNSTSISNHWSPVLILSSKRLDMVCKLNSEEEEKKHNAPTWTCSSRRIIDAFFSLPNTAVLTGGDLRVDILLSHHKSQKALRDGLWFDEQGGIMSEADDDYVISGVNDNLAMSSAEKILSSADISRPQQLLAELSSTSLYKLQHQSMAYNNVIEGTRIFSLTVTLVFLCYWWWSMGVASEGFDMIDSEEDTTATSLWARITSPIYKVVRMVSRRCKRNNQAYRFWWQDPWCMFPERRYLLLLLFCLIMLQNPLLAYAFFHPSLYGSARFRFAADTVSGMSVHGILFLWLCLVHGLRYHTAEISRRRLAFHSRILELRNATSHMSPNNTEFEDTQWGRVRWYYQQYGDIEGGGTAVLKMKHDTESDSFVEFMFPKVALLFIGIVASITAAASRFPMSESKSISERIELNPDRFGSGSKVYVLSSIVQLIVIQIWSIFIIYTSFVTGERLKREPFLSTRPAQLAFRVSYISLRYLRCFFT